MSIYIQEFSLKHMTVSVKSYPSNFFRVQLKVRPFIVGHGLNIVEKQSPVNIKDRPNLLDMEGRKEEFSLVRSCLIYFLIRIFFI